MDVLFIIILEAGVHKKTWVWSVGWLEQERSAGWWSAVARAIARHELLVGGQHS